MSSRTLDIEERTWGRDGIEAPAFVAAEVKDYARSVDFGGEGHVTDQGVDGLAHILFLFGAEVYEVYAVEKDGGQ